MNNFLTFLKNLFNVNNTTQTDHDLMSTQNFYEELIDTSWSGYATK